MTTMLELAEELREYTAMKYAGDRKCGKCQLVPRKLVERIYHTLNSAALPQEAPAQPQAARGQLDDWEHIRSALETLSNPASIGIVEGLSGSNRVLAKINRMRDIAKTAALHLPAKPAALSPTKPGGTGE